jgi:enoyl-CoA hydratase
MDIPFEVLEQYGWEPPRQALSKSVHEVEEITYEVEDRVGRITIDRPEKKNTLRIDMRQAIYDAVKRAEIDDEVKVIVIQGTGGNFCAGHDLSQIYKVYQGYDGEEAGEQRPSMRARLHRDTQLLESYRGLLFSLKPIITRIDGWCVGGGMFMNMCADISIAAESAKLSHREQRLVFSGVSFFNALEFLELGPRKARELMLTGESIPGTEAEEIGLVNRAVPEADLDDEVERYCEAIKLLPLDGIVIGEMMTNVAYETLGIGQSLSNGIIGHTLATNLRWEDDEYNFVGTREKEDTSAAIEQLHERFADLGFN